MTTRRVTLTFASVTTDNTTAIIASQQFRVLAEACAKGVEAGHKTITLKGTLGRTVEIDPARALDDLAAVGICTWAVEEEP